MTEAQRQAIQEARDIDTGVDTRTKEEMLAEQMAGLGSVGKTVVENIPGIGETIVAKEIAEDVSAGDYLSAGIGTAALGMGFLPAGDILNKPLRAAAKKFRKQDIEAAKKLMTDDDAAKTWKEANKLSESQRQKRVPEVQKAATDLSEGKITSKEYRRVVTANQPIKPITKENFPEMPTKTEIVGALKATDPRKVDTGIIGLNKNIPDGTRVGSRLDIPSYDKMDKWIVSLHDGTKKGGQSIGYGQSAVLKNVEFVSSAKGGLNIAKNKDKATIARIHGDYYNAEPENVFEAAKSLIDNPEWTQVGMNPFRHSFFYDKATGKPVTRADEVIQVGPLVLAKGVKQPTISELKSLGVKTKDGKIRMFNEGGVVMQKQMELFEDGGLMDEGNTIDPVSGNDVPPGSMQEEVRDDIPAQLSEGEFVFPADVVRYHGLDKLMEMRQEAKMGLKMMEEMGQMGNAEEATMPDDLPFDIEDLDIEDDNEPMEMQIGGYVPGQYQQGYGTYTLPGTGIMQQQPSYLSGYGQTPQQTYDYGVYNVPAYQQFTPATYTPEPYTGPTFEELIPSTTGRYDEIRRYVNAEGQVRMIPFVDGKPIYPIPPGFYPEAEAKQPDIPAPTDVYTGTARVREEGDGQREQQETQIFGGNVNTTKSDIYSSAVKAQAKHQLSSLSPVIGAGTSLFGGVSANDLAIAGNQARLAAVSSLGYDDISEVSTSDLDIVGNAMNIAYETVKDLTEEEGKPLGTARIKSISRIAADAASRDPATERAKIEAAKAARDAREKAALEEMERREKGLDTIKMPTIDEAVPGGRFETAAVSPAKAAEARRQVEAREGRGNIVRDSSGKPVTSGGRAITTRAGSELSSTDEGREQIERQAEAIREEVEAKRQAEAEARRQAGIEARRQAEAKREAAQKQEKDEREERERQERQQKAQEKGGAYAGTGPERGRGGRDDDGGGGGGGGKIVCTEMYRQTQLDDWAKAIKIWDVYQKKHLTPYHEKGYHWLFKPYVQGMKKSNLLTKFGAYLAKQRTQHLRYVLTKGRAKDSIVGNIWCKIIHPIVYVAGRIK